MNPLIFWAMLIVSAFCAACSKSSVQKISDIDVEPVDATPEVYKPFWPGTYSPKTEAELRNTLPFEQVALERHATMTEHPDYRVVFHRSGLAEMDVKGGPSKGRFTSQIGADNYARLCYLIERTRFDTMLADYSATTSDSEKVIVTVAGSGGVRSVSDYGMAGPLDMWTIQETIDALKAGCVWEAVK